MLRRPPIDGRGSSQHQKLLLAFAVILLPWFQFAEGQHHQQRQPVPHNVHSVIPPHRAPDDDGSLGNNNNIYHESLTATSISGSGPSAVRHWDTTPISAASAAIESQDGLNSQKNSALGEQRQQKHKQHQQQARRSSTGIPVDTNNKKHARRDHILIPDDASALATLAPAQPVRAPNPPRHQKPSSTPASGLSSPQLARSLEDWEVEDFVLLATVDGDLFATDRKTGKERWHLEVDQPMVETKHYRANKSVLDEDYSPVDHYIWAIEPNRDGGVYVWVPEPEARPRTTGFTMKQLVEELSPYAGDEPSVVYVGDKKTTMITIDASSGRVIKWFGTAGSHINEAESCLKPNALYDKGNEECSSTGTITLGRTEYTVGIERRDGKRIATLKYAEWTPNNRDNDLFHQYHVSKDSRYITTRHDGKVYAFDYGRSDVTSPLFSQKFAAPVARVFDVCRPWDATAESNPDLVLLPQPTMPSQDESMANMRSNSIFLNRTEEGSWYALSGRAYPLIIDAPLAQASFPEWWDMTASWDSLTEAKVSKALVGTHSLAKFRPARQLPTLPEGSGVGDAEDLNNPSVLPVVNADELDEPTIVDKVKSLPQSAANSVNDFVRNPVLFIIFFVALVYNQKKLRRAYHRFRNGSGLLDTVLYLTSEGSVSGKTPSQDDDSSEPKAKLLDKSTSNENLDEGSSLKTDVKTSGPTSSEEESHQMKVNDINDIQTSKDKAETSRSLGHEPGSAAAEEKSSQGSGDAAETNGSATELKKKKAHRGRRGGVKHRKGRLREPSQSRDDEAPNATVEEAVSNAKKLGDRPSWEPDVMTVANDMQAVSGPVIRMGNIEVNTDEQLGTGSNGTLVFAGKFDGREVAVKRMLIQFYDIASQETRLLRESDDHPNGK